jgi:hypothetical protein
MPPLGDTLQGVDELTAGQWLGKRFALAFVHLDVVLDDLAQLGENRLGILPVAATVEQLRATADKTMVLVRPLHQLDVLVALVHCSDSSIKPRVPRIFQFASR